MELDDQLAALVAGELDADTARALRARAAADAALAQRLARHEHLHELLTNWDAPPMSDEAAARLDAAVDEALDALDDGPLAARLAAAGPRSAAPAAATEPSPAAASRRGSDGEVADLAAARERRERRRSLPSWVGGATVAAALLGVVGAGVLAGGLTSSDDSAMDMADAPTSESAEDDAGDGFTSADGAADEEMAEESALASADSFEVDLAEGELLALLDAVGSADATSTQGGDQAESDEAADEEAASEPAACVVEALERDTAAADGREVALVAGGTYAEQPAQFVVVRTPTDGAERLEVLAYDPTDCSLLARDETVR